MRKSLAILAAVAAFAAGGSALAAPSPVSPTVASRHDALTAVKSSHKTHHKGRHHKSSHKVAHKGGHKSAKAA